MLLSVQRGDFTRPQELKPDIPTALEAICLKAMALRPEDRYVSPLVLADDLERWLAGAPVFALKPEAGLRPRLWQRLFNWWRSRG
jgi:hypothetical protein